MQPLSTETAQELLHAHMQNKNLRRHCYAVGKALATYFDYYTGEGRNLGGLTREQWEIAGILHDADWEVTANDESKHTVELLEWLKDYDAPMELVDVFKSHNNARTHLREPQTLLEWFPHAQARGTPTNSSSPNQRFSFT